MEGKLRWVVQLCRGIHIAGSSRRTYLGHHKIFLEFCSEFGMDPLLIDENELAMVTSFKVMMTTGTQQGR